MRQFGTIVLVLVVLAVLPAVGAAADGETGPGAVEFLQDEETEDGATVDEDEITPGERLGGMIGVQQAEIEGEVRERGFGMALERSATDHNRTADLVANQQERQQQRLADLEERHAQVREDCEEMTPGACQAAMARIGAERAHTERMLNHTQATAMGLPEERLEERNINVTAIAELRERAHMMGGQEVRDHARAIAGPRAGHGHGPAHSPGEPPHAPPRNETGIPGPGPDGEMPGPGFDGERPGPGHEGGMAGSDTNDDMPGPGGDGDMPGPGGDGGQAGPGGNGGQGP